MAVLHTACDSHIEQSSLLLYLALCLAEGRREEVLLQSNDKSMAELQSLGSMYGEQGHTCLCIVQVLILIGEQTYLRQEVGYRGEVYTLLLTLLAELVDTGEHLL